MCGRKFAQFAEVMSKSILIALCFCYAREVCLCSRFSFVRLLSTPYRAVQHFIDQRVHITGVESLLKSGQFVHTAAKGPYIRLKVVGLQRERERERERNEEAKMSDAIS